MLASEVQEVALQTSKATEEIRRQVAAMQDVPIQTFEDCLFVSVVPYASPSRGNHVPLGHTRLPTGVEAPTGPMLIGWSASVTYLAMERYRPLHG